MRASMHPRPAVVHFSTGLVLRAGSGGIFSRSAVDSFLLIEVIWMQSKAESDPHRPRRLVSSCHDVDVLDQF
jgi:hypothetical protein